jgi:hypothetical protein
MSLSELGQDQLLLKAVELSEKFQQSEADLATIRAALKRTSEERNELHHLIHDEDGYIASQDADQLEIGLIKEERDRFKKICDDSAPVVKEAREEIARLKSDNVRLQESAVIAQAYAEQSDGYADEIIRLRELLRDCPLLTGKAFSDSKISEVWIERAREEALKL